MRSSPDSSTDPWGCPQCGKGNASEAGLLEHLLQVHNIRVVPPQSPTTTRCPVCRKHVADLPHHFALEHGENTIKTEEIMEEVTLPNVPNGASITRIIPIVLPNISGKFKDPFAWPCNCKQTPPLRFLIRPQVCFSFCFLQFLAIFKQRSIVNWKF